MRVQVSLKRKMITVLNNIQIFLIYFTIICIILTLFLIITQKNPIYAVFSFILTAFFTFLFLILIGAEFIALLILIIYTGVITVLFLFVVIIYDLESLNFNFSSVFLNPMLILILYKVLWASRFYYLTIVKWFHPTLFCNVTDIEDADNIFFKLDIINYIPLFNEHYFLLFFVGLLIFLAILGSIVITYPFYKYKK